MLKAIALDTVWPAEAHWRRDEAREWLADSIDPGQVKLGDKQVVADLELNTLKSVARDWRVKTAAKRAQNTQKQNPAWFEQNVFPSTGKAPIAPLSLRGGLVLLQKMAACGAIESAHKINQLAEQVLRHGIASGMRERDATANLRGALEVIQKTRCAAIAKPAQAGALGR